MAQPDGRPLGPRITVLISGSGTNLAAIIAATHTQSLLPPNTSICRVISDRASAYGLTRAQDAGIPTTHHGIIPYKKKLGNNDAKDRLDTRVRTAYDARLAEIVLEDKPDLVACAGFMRILTPAFLEPLASSGTPIINLHPSLHGDLVGAGCIQRAWAEYEEGKRKDTGIMVHYVITEVDMGEPVVQREVSIEGCTTLQDLEQRLHEVEHELIVKGTKLALEAKKKSG